MDAEEVLIGLSVLIGVLFTITIALLAYTRIEDYLFSLRNRPKPIFGRAHCPHCRLDITDMIEAKTRYRTMSCYNCECGCYSEWDVFGFPPQIVSFKRPEISATNT